MIRSHPKKSIKEALRKQYVGIEESNTMLMGFFVRE